MASMNRRSIVAIILVIELNSFSLLNVAFLIVLGVLIQAYFISLAYFLLIGKHNHEYITHITQS